MVTTVIELLLCTECSVPQGQDSCRAVHATTVSWGGTVNAKPQIRGANSSHCPGGPEGGGGGPGAGEVLSGGSQGKPFLGGDLTLRLEK